MIHPFCLYLFCSYSWFVPESTLAKSPWRILGCGPSSAGGTTKIAGKAKADMALTRSFKETVQARVQRDAAFREALLTEAIDALLAGDVGTGKAVLRDTRPSGSSGWPGKPRCRPRA
jgi:hypothetical protein